MTFLIWTSSTQNNDIGSISSPFLSRLLLLFTMPSDDLKNYATSDTDFYELLGITFETSQRDIDRAWRKTALKYHPDKVGADPVAKEKFHLAQIGYDLLSDPAIKLLYDNTRTARLQRKRQNELFEGRRRQMKDDLEARERGVKRGREEEEGDEEKLEREIRRLAEDGQRRRKEREERLKKDLQQQAEAGPSNVSDAAATAAPATGNPSTHTTNQNSVSELDRTIQVRWPQEASSSEPLQAQAIHSLFSIFGPIESADILTPKILRIGRKNKKHLVFTCMIQYSSVVGAHAAVEDFKKQSGPEWSRFDSVFWAANKEPAFINSLPEPTLSTTTTPYPPSKSSRFSSSSSSSPLGSRSGLNGPSQEELTMIRLKNAEKKRLADQIRRQHEQTAASAIQG